MRKHLNFCIQTEEIVAKIYRQMANSPHLTLAVKETLQELAADEDDHASQLRFALRFTDGSVITSQPDMLRQAEEMLNQAQLLLQKMLPTEVDDHQAISTGVELEKNFSRVHLANACEFKDKKFAEMFAAMAKEDERHCHRLLELQKNL